MAPLQSPGVGWLFHRVTSRRRRDGSDENERGPA
jgi:hypothetical protein